MMKLSILLTVLTTCLTRVFADCDFTGGNYYCEQVDAVVYSGIGYSGSYQDVTNMDEDSCVCSQSSKSVGGTLSPLNEELSVHFRGPLNLKQFGVYYPSGSGNLKKRDAEDCTTTQHIHHHHKRAVKIVEVTETVLVDQNGNLITRAATTTSTQGDDEVTSTSQSSVTTSTYTPTTLETSTSSSSSSDEAETTEASSSSSNSAWNRVSYYQPGSITNTTFLNTLGGVSGSGTWSACFGNSLSYCAADGVGASGESVALDDVTVESDTEFMIMSGASCDDNSVGDCGYYRSGIPLYHGFGGAEKIFVFEFGMPTETSGSAPSNNYDMPLIWLLNAKIPRTLQYGDSSCSCWSTGCGELDLFEILSSGEDRLISHLHSGQGSGTAQGGGGSQDYFQRPTSGTVKAAAIFSNGEVHIVILDNDTDFSAGLSLETVAQWNSLTGGTAIIG